MRKKLTITLNEQIYEGLHAVIGRRKISGFIESLVRPHVARTDLDAAYKEMSKDNAREAEALKLTEATFGDIANETR